MKKYKLVRLEERGKDYPLFKDDVKMELFMSKEERRKWFSDEEIEEWRKEYPKGERRGSLW